MRSPHDPQARLARLARLVPGARLASLIVGLAGAVATAGCGGSHGHSPDDAGDVPLFYDCTTEPRAVPAVPGLTITSSSKGLSATLDSLVPASLVKGNNTWNVHFTNAAGETLTGATVKVTPTMPLHQHGTRPVGVKALDAGGYELNPLYLYMAGYWEVLVDVTSEGATDSVMFPVCIPG